LIKNIISNLSTPRIDDFCNCNKKSKSISLKARKELKYCWFYPLSKLVWRRKWSNQTKSRSKSRFRKSLSNHKNSKKGKKNFLKLFSWYLKMKILIWALLPVKHPFRYFIRRKCNLVKINIESFISFSLLVFILWWWNVEDWRDVENICTEFYGTFFC
jgi:hypothetical protein